MTAFKLVDVDIQTGYLRPVTATLDILRKLPQTCIVVGAVGPERTFKSSLLNKLSGDKANFPTRKTFHNGSSGMTIEEDAQSQATSIRFSGTQGVWVYIDENPDEVTARVKSKINDDHLEDSKALILLDCEGLVSFADRKIRLLSDKLFMLMTALSSCLCLNTTGDISEATFDSLRPIAEIFHHLDAPYSSFTQEQLPPLIWVAHNHNLPSYMPSEQHYLQHLLTSRGPLKPNAGSGSPGRKESRGKYNEVRKAMRELFVNREMVIVPTPENPSYIDTWPQPATESASKSKLSKFSKSLFGGRSKEVVPANATASATIPYYEQMERCFRSVFEKAQVKRMWKSGSKFSLAIKGFDFANMVIEYCNALNQNRKVKLTSMWEVVFDSVWDDILHSTIESYDEIMTTLTAKEMPMSLTRLREKHDECMRVINDGFDQSEIDMFRDEGKNLYTELSLRLGQFQDDGSPPASSCALKKFIIQNYESGIKQANATLRYLHSHVLDKIQKTQYRTIQEYDTDMGDIIRMYNSTEFALSPVTQQKVLEAFLKTIETERQRILTQLVTVTTPNQSGFPRASMDRMSVSNANNDEVIRQRQLQQQHMTPEQLEQWLLEQIQWHQSEEQRHREMVEKLVLERQNVLRMVESKQQRLHESLPDVPVISVDLRDSGLGAVDGSVSFLASKSVSDVHDFGVVVEPKENGDDVVDTVRHPSLEKALPMKEIDELEDLPPPVDHSHNQGNPTEMSEDEDMQEGKQTSGDEEIDGDLTPKPKYLSTPQRHINGSPNDLSPIPILDATPPKQSINSSSTDRTPPSPLVVLAPSPQPQNDSQESDTSIAESASSPSEQEATTSSNPSRSRSEASSPILPVQSDAEKSSRSTSRSDETVYEEEEDEMEEEQGSSQPSTPEVEQEEEEEKEEEVDPEPEITSTPEPLLTVRRKLSNRSSSPTIPSQKPARTRHLTQRLSKRVSRTREEKKRELGIANGVAYRPNSLEWMEGLVAEVDKAIEELALRSVN